MLLLTGLITVGDSGQLSHGHSSSSLTTVMSPVGKS